MATEAKPYRPDVPVPPGAAIRATLEDLGMTQTELAQRMGRPANKLNEIIQGKIAVTPQTAVELSRTLGIPAPVWLRMEQNYQLAKAEAEAAAELPAEAKLAARFPYAAMAKLGMVPSARGDAATVAALREFFGVSALPNVDQPLVLGAAWRKSRHADASPHALAAWLRQGQRVAAKRPLVDFDKPAAKAAAAELRPLTALPMREAAPRARDVLAGVGVALVVVPHLPKTYVSGAAYWLGERPTIQVSGRGLRLDAFWFTLLHELAHLLLHKRSATYLDDETGEAGAESQEAEADAFASQTLLPPPSAKRLAALESLSTLTLKRLAQELGIGPSILSGRLRHEGRLRHADLPGLATTFKLEDLAALTA